MDAEKQILVFTGSQLLTSFLKDKLEEAEIGYYINNENDSARVAGFGIPAGFMNGCKLFIHEKDQLKAEPIINEFLKINKLK
jgi:hypothetical protein